MGQPSDEMPMPGGQEQLKLIDSVDKSLYEMMMGVHHMAMRLSHGSSSTTVVKMARAVMADPSNGRPMFTLLHSTSKGMIKSIVRGSVALDTADGLAWYEAPAAKEAAGGGVYVIGLSRRGQNGRYLDVLEMAKLARGLQDYRRGAMLVGSSGRLTQRDQRCIDFGM